MGISFSRAFALAALRTIIEAYIIPLLLPLLDLAIESPKRRMILSDLPPEILDQILHFKDISYLIIELWKCGSPRLNSKLASGITYIHLETEGFFPRFLPLVLFKLRSLRYLYASFESSNAKQVSTVVKALPPTGRALRPHNFRDIFFLEFGA